MQRVCCGWCWIANYALQLLVNYFFPSGRVGSDVWIEWQRVRAIPDFFPLSVGLLVTVERQRMCFNFRLINSPNQVVLSDNVCTASSDRVVSSDQRACTAIHRSFISVGSWVSVRVMGYLSPQSGSGQAVFRHIRLYKVHPVTRGPCSTPRPHIEVTYWPTSAALQSVGQA